MAPVQAGHLYKRGKDGKLSRRNWKRRFFLLDHESLSWFVEEGGKKLGHLLLTDHVLLEVKPADATKTGHSASTEWRLRITVEGRRLLVSANSEQEMNNWAAALHVVVGPNLIIEGTNGEVAHIAGERRKLSDQLKTDHGLLGDGSSPFQHDNRLRKQLQTEQKAEQKRRTLAQHNGDTAERFWCPDPIEAWALRTLVKRDVIAGTLDMAPMAEPSSGKGGGVEGAIAHGDGNAKLMHTKIRGAQGARQRVNHTLARQKRKDTFRHSCHYEWMCVVAPSEPLRLSSTTYTPREDECLQLDPTHLDHSVSDLADIDRLHPAPLLHLLHRRFQSNTIYTHVSEVKDELSMFFLGSFFPLMLLHSISIIAAKVK